MQLLQKKQGLKKQLIIFFLIITCISQSGCSLLTLPIKAIETVFDVVGQVFKLVDKLPKPPPGVF